MAKKPLSPERKLSAKRKHLGLTLTQLKGLIDSADGNFRHPLVIGPKEEVRLIVRCKHVNIPECWAMAMLQHNVRFDGIDYHTTIYKDGSGAQRLGWHRDLRESDVTVEKVPLPNFNPVTLEQFILDGLAMFNVILEPEGSGGDEQMRIDP